MKVLKQCVGIDISKDSFHATFGQLFEDMTTSYSKSKIFANAKEGFREFIKWRKSLSIAGCQVNYLMEATGIYYEELAYYLDSKSCKQHVILPNMSKNFVKSLNIKSKTDEIDSKVLSQLGLERNLPEWQPPESFFKQLRSLTRYYHQLKNDLTLHKNQLHSIERSKDRDAFIMRQKKQLIKIIEDQCSACMKRMEQQISESDYAEEFACLRTIPGVGLVTTTTIVAETLGFKMFKNRKQLVSFAGYDVMKNQSGTSVNGMERISKKGNKFIRKALYFPALSSVRSSEDMKVFYSRIFDRRKIKMVSYVAVQRKLLLLTFALWKNKANFVEGYASKQAKIEVA